MPDLTLEAMHQCAAMRHAVGNVGGYTQTGLFDERRWPTCTCKAYQFAVNGRTNFGGRMVPNPCKHIEAAQAAVCQYHEMIDGKPTEDGHCPKCGGPVEVVMVAV